MVRPATKDKPSARCLPFQHFALQTYLRSKSYRRQWGLKRCKSTRTVKARIDPRVSYPRIKDFEARYRLPPSCVEELTDEFEESAFRPGKGKHETRGSPIPLFHKVCYALRFLATGSYYTVIRDTQGGVSRSSVGRAVTAFVKFLVSRYKRHVSFPKEEALHLAAVNFAQRHKVNKCIGCIDGTYVPLMRPTRNEHVYVCRKGYHALNVMVVSDYEEKILYVESGMSGCHHDQSVLAYSDLGHHMAYRPERFGGYFLLGDGGYKLTPQVLTPFRCKMLSELEPHQQRYQVAHVTARSSVERCIGQLKSRWRVLSKSGVGALHMQPLQASWVVKACCVLHNRCVDWGLRKLRPGDNRDPEMEMRIRVEARARFLRANRHLQPEDVPAGDGLHPDNYGPGHAGVRYRQRYIYNQYGGPAPVDIGRGTRRQRGTGARGRGRGRGGARGRGRGQGQAGRPR